jgi:hypothetical protein
MNDSARSLPNSGLAIGCHALVEARLSEIGSLRDQASPPGCPPLPPRFLRHADEHTVVGLQAVLAALATHPRQPVVGCHGIVAAPCQAGRIVGAQTLAAFSSGGAVTVSPHVVPQCSLHSVAGAVSVALGMHGPHLGVGGGPEALGEGLLVASSFIAGGGDPDCTGMWLVATEWDDEPRLDAAGMPQNDPCCRGLALLLEPVPEPDDGGELSAPLAFDMRMTRLARGPRVPAASGSLVALATALDMCREGGALASWAVACPGGGEIRVRSQLRRSASWTGQPAVRGAA